jgi:ABC-type uncharacterized transport system permease subunit
MLMATLALTMVGYLTSATVFYLALVRSPASASILAWARRLLVLAIVAHIGDIVARSFTLHACPVQSAAFALSLAALVATVGFLTWARSGRLLSLGVIVVPLSLGMFVASQVLLQKAVATDVPGWFLAFHVLANLTAVALFVIAAAAAIAYLYQAARLKSKRPAAGGIAFPGLSSLESIIERSLAWGLGPMTLGVISGAVFAERLSRGGIESLRVTLAYTCWLGVASLVVGQRLVGWNGRKVAWGAITMATIAVAIVVLYALSAGGHA